MPAFMLPWAFAGLASLAGLAAVYWLRNRFRRRRVSALFLWLDQRQARAGGKRVRRFQAPLLFFIELLVLALLVCGAAMPRVRAPGRRPLVVVLDDSYSMSAGGGESPRALGEKAVLDEVAAGGRYAVRFMLAGPAPRMLGGAATNLAEAERQLAEWTCRAPSADLDRALAMAAETGGESTRVLVVTDRAPANRIEEGRVQWWAFGRPRPNIAFTNAARGRKGAGRDRCLVEMTNLSPDPRVVEVSLVGEPRTIAFDGWESRRLFFDIENSQRTVRAEIADAVLPIDNVVLLAPEPRRVIRFSVRVAEESARDAVRRAVGALDDALLADARPHIVVSDRPEADSLSNPAWRMILERGGEGAAYLGPFVVDRGHPLAEGVSFGGVVWGAGDHAEARGRAVVAAGNRVLLADEERLDGGRVFRLAFDPALSTLHESPAWPKLFWNLARMRAEAEPGVRRANVRLGWRGEIVAPRGVDALRVDTPGAEALASRVVAGAAQLSADQVGIHTVRAGESELGRFSVNALNPVESNLWDCATGRWGDWARAESLRWEYRNAAWMFLVPALALLALHLALIARGSE